MNTRVRVAAAACVVFGLAVLVGLFLKSQQNRAASQSSVTVYRGEDMQKALTDAGYIVTDLRIGVDDTRVATAVDMRSIMPVDRFTATVNHPSIPGCTLNLEQKWGESIRLDEVGGSDAIGFVGDPLDPQLVVSYVKVYKPKCLT